MDGLYEQFRIALHQIWRRRWMAMAVAWGVAVLGWLVIALIPNSYEAKARLFVQMQSILPTQVGAQPDGMIEITANSNVSGFSNGQNARTAAATVQGLIDLFIEQNLSGDRRETGQSLQFLDEELRRRETQLQEAEQRRVEFEQRFSGLLPGSGSIAQRMPAALAELAHI